MSEVITIDVNGYNNIVARDEQGNVTLKALKVILKKAGTEIGRTHYTTDKRGLNHPITTKAEANQIGRAQVRAHGGTPYSYEVA